MRILRTRIVRDITLIEVVIVAAMLLILASVVSEVLSGRSSDRTYCAGGHLFEKSSHRQILNTEGGGIPCNTPR
jgi:hypothetical protein